MATGIDLTSLHERQIVTFLLGQAEFGADIMDVKEIIRVPDITQVPNAPEYVEGACNLRGDVLPVIDGRTRFNIEKKSIDNYSRVLVVDVEGKATGVIVDKVSEVMKVSTLNIEEPPNILKNVNANYLNGVVKLNNGRRLIMLLDVVKALKAATDQQEENDHQERASLNGEKSQNNEGIAEEQLVSFNLGKEEYAIGIMQVQEIIRVPQIVKVPNCESYVEGVLSLRDQLLPIINLRVYFGMEHKEITNQTRILVANLGGLTVGLLVDKVSEVLRVPKSTILQPPRFSNQDEVRLKGVAKLNEGERIILVLDPNHLVSAEEMSQITNANYEGESLADHDQSSPSLPRQGEKDAQVLHEEEQLVICKIHREEYGIKISHVQEINRMTEVTKVPRVPDYIVGIVNLRGNVIPALDLRKFFDLTEGQITDATRIIIVEVAGKRTGIVVDAVSEVLSLDKNLIEPPPPSLKKWD